MNALEKVMLLLLLFFLKGLLMKTILLSKCNIDKITVAHLNTISLRNKFNSLIGQITDVSETKLD